MPHVTFHAMETAEAEAYRAGHLDANGMPPEKAVAVGATPCRHCLRYLAEGTPILILAHRPFATKQPYAESGPVFICADSCTRWEGQGLPPLFEQDGPETRLLKGYSPDDRIVYGLGQHVTQTRIPEAAATMLNDPRVAYVHVRSSENNCFTCRIDPA